MKKYFLTTSIILLTALLTGFAPPWYRFTPADQTYTLEFPKQPEVSEQAIPSEMGDLKLELVVLDMSQDPASENLVYMAATTTYPEEIAEALDEEGVKVMFDGAVEGALSNSQSTLISQKSITHQGYPGREIRADYGDGEAIITLQMYLAKNKLYMVQAICMTTKDGNADAKRFFDSFSLQ